MWNVLIGLGLYLQVGCTPELTHQEAASAIEARLSLTQEQYSTVVLDGLWLPRAGVAQLQLMGWSKSRGGVANLTDADNRMPRVKCYRALEPHGVVSGGHLVKVPSPVAGEWHPRWEFNYQAPLAPRGGPRSGSMGELRVVYGHCDGVEVIDVAYPERGLADVTWRPSCAPNIEGMRIVTACGKTVQLPSQALARIRFAQVGGAWQPR